MYDVYNMMYELECKWLYLTSYSIHPISYIKTGSGIVQGQSRLFVDLRTGYTA